ncbi:MAG: protein tyrosine phosphatase family protein [Anaerolineales bacterium]|nr:protein tyrosine phosphatase family protein [Anaerolineales bacterium]
MKDIYNFLQLTDTLFSSGMPTPEQLPLLAENGVQVVINLATSKSEGAIPNEKELIEALKIKYYNIPVEWSAPTAEDLQQFFDLMDEHKKSKVLVHCQANYRATGFVTLYRILRLGWEKDKAFVEMNKIWNPEDFPIWQSFIDKSLNGK